MAVRGEEIADAGEGVEGAEDNDAAAGADEEKYTEEAGQRWRRAAEAAEDLAVKMDGSCTPAAARDGRFNKSLGDDSPPPTGGQGDATKVERRCRCM